MNALAALAEMSFDEFLDLLTERMRAGSTPNNAQYADETEETISAAEARLFTGKGDTDLWSGVKNGDYPKPVSTPGKARRWRKADWLKWQKRNADAWAEAPRRA